MDEVLLEQFTSPLCDGYSLVWRGSERDTTRRYVIYSTRDLIMGAGQAEFHASHFKPLERGTKVKWELYLVFSLQRYCRYESKPILYLNVSTVIFHSSSV